VQEQIASHFCAEDLSIDGPKADVVDLLMHTHRVVVAKKMASDIANKVKQNALQGEGTAYVVLKDLASYNQVMAPSLYEDTGSVHGDPDHPDKYEGPITSTHRYFKSGMLHLWMNLNHDNVCQEYKPILKKTLLDAGFYNVDFYLLHDEEKYPAEVRGDCDDVPTFEVPVCVYLRWAGARKRARA